MPCSAHVNSETLPQLASLVVIDPVASKMIATFHGCVAPCIDATAVACVISFLTPNSPMNHVGMLTCSVILMAFATAEPLPFMLVPWVPPELVKMRIVGHGFVTIG